MFDNRGILPAALWMFGLSLVLGWLPFIGPAVAGVVGGLQAGGVANALVAAVIPAALVAALAWLFGVVLDLAILGALLGAGLFMVLVIGALPLLAGAWLGGTLSERRERSRSA
jgi:hypothetical protein